MDRQGAGRGGEGAEGGVEGDDVYRYVYIF